MSMLSAPLLGRFSTISDLAWEKERNGSQFLLGLLIFIGGFIPGGFGTFDMHPTATVSISWAFFALLQAGGLLITTLTDGA
jgi:hypothetical protein